MINKDKSRVFVSNDAIDWQDMENGIKRKIMSYDDNLMLVKVAFEKGGIGTPHSHYHSQITHIESGVFEVQIGNEKQTLKAGDAFYIPPNVVHGAVCLEAGVLIDVFSPMREDFLS